MDSDLITGEDGAARCGWAGRTPDYTRYHDEEWGHPVHGDAALFERLVLEGFQAGLSWITVLRKRPRFRAVFDGFDPRAVAGYTDADVERLLADAGIIRNRQKILAAIANAGLVAEMAPGGFDELLWSFAPAAAPRPRSLREVPAITPESTAMSAALRARGFRFVGPTTMYALMQATGMVDDHLAGCWRAEASARTS